VPFYVMEYCDGGSLADRLNTSGRLPPAELVPIVAAVSDGL
jgi:serine/threonine protein kinase